VGLFLHRFRACPSLTTRHYSEPLASSKRTHRAPPSRMGGARAASHTELRKSIRKIPAYSVYNQIARILRESQEGGTEQQFSSSCEHFEGVTHGVSFLV
jgi:hypothetical protein